MNVTTLTFDLAQLALLGGMIWGLAQMSKSVTVLNDVTDKLVVGLERVSDALGALGTRVSILEDRGKR